MKKKVMGYVGEAARGKMRELGFDVDDEGNLDYGYDITGLSDKLLGKKSKGGSVEKGQGLSRYRLGLSRCSTAISVKSVQGEEHISEVWRYVVRFTSHDHHLPVDAILSQRAVLALAPPEDEFLQPDKKFNADFIMGGGKSSIFDAVKKAIPVDFDSISNINKSVNGALNIFDTAKKLVKNQVGIGENRLLHGVVTAFSQLSRSRDESEYEIVLAPRLSLLSNNHSSVIYQHQTVPQVVEEVLRRNGFTGVDFRFELLEHYPSREYITQWQEDDLTFIRRILADVGIWFRFEDHIKHNCDVVIFGDSEQPWQKGLSIPYRPLSGLDSNHQASVWDLRVTRKTVPQSVQMQDYNYRNAQVPMKIEINSTPKDPTTRGKYYYYGEHYLDRGEEIATGKSLNSSKNPLNKAMEAFGGGKLGDSLGGLPSDLAGAGDALNGVAGQAQQQVSAGVDKAKSGISSATDRLSSVGSSLSDPSGVMDKGKSLLSGLTGDNTDDNQETKEEQSNGQGSWLARIRHQRFISEQVVIKGYSSQTELAVGQLVKIPDSPISEAVSGILIIAVSSHGSREQPYQLEFTAIPFHVLKPYRPALLPWPQISGTIPARVTSDREKDNFSHLDKDGRYHVQMDFDLKGGWRKGYESVALRLAKPFAGRDYGFHFPLIKGTEVAVAFVEGNPDRPYIAHALHDSSRPDVVTLQNYRRNVIRTQSNNKLRMDDDENKQHIKLATEYGKSQLNLGHLVNNKREKRGDGFELRTDEWGAIRAGKGLLISAEAQSKAGGQVLDMQDVISQLQCALKLAQSLANESGKAGIPGANVSSQKTFLDQNLTNLKQSAILVSAPSGIALSAPDNIQTSAGKNLTLTAGENVDISVLKQLTLAAKKAFSLFVHELGMKIVAAAGNIEITAEKDQMKLTAEKGLHITSNNDEVIISANKKIRLVCNGSSIVLDGSKIEIASQGGILNKGASFSIAGPMGSAPPQKGFSSCESLAGAAAENGDAVMTLS